MGTWQTFDTSNKEKHLQLTAVLGEMQKSGAKLIDSSPMYGKSEKVIGELTPSIENHNDFFYATKVWTTGLKSGIEQMEKSMRLMQRQSIDLMQIHNLKDWKTHIKTLREWKEIGKIKYIGITHYTDSMHEDLEKIIKSEKIDFVQFNYSIEDRNAEKSLFATAADHGVATLINRPFGEGRLFKKVRGKALPEWAIENGIDNWSNFFLQYIIANPAVTCVIPATSNPLHATDNFNAGKVIIDENLKEKMVGYLTHL
ncbi:MULTISPECIES: aldo/keto reductase [unclassified Flavobacterium]|uniref:aldo/keto reductase n=1 Tax=unclassified Flavobacterium TaxID=196869 RepID=UPI001E580D1C|nr:MULTISPECIES: aldo/keto reductase [unclassified Flavobacterium]